MSFCPYCGNQVMEGMAFCPSCGKKVVVRGKGDMEIGANSSTTETVNCASNIQTPPTNPIPSRTEESSIKSANREPQRTTREQVFEGNIHKCPNCGAVVDAFSIKCKACGFEFRDTDLSMSVKEFANFIRNEECKEPKISDSFNARQKAALAKRAKIETANTVSNYIRMYSVPNNKEDMLEFLFLASSNIDTKALFPHERERAAAWFAKVEQVYNKAKVAFYNQEDFSMFEKAYKESESKYQEAMAALEKHRSRKVRRIVIPIVGGVVGYILLMVVLLVPLSIQENVEKAKQDKESERLNQIVMEIQEDISNGRYEEALMNANRLHYDSNLDTSYGDKKVQEWDEQREFYIEYINGKMKGN